MSGSEERWKGFEDPTRKIRLRHLWFLDRLRDSGITNMFGAVPFILEEFPGMDKKDASHVLSYWMKNFKL